MTQMLAQREHDYFAETVICANCYIVALFYEHAFRMQQHGFCLRQLGFNMRQHGFCLQQY